jgi:hypothetical protein
MWRKRTEREVMDEWTSRALAGVPEGSVAQAKALVGRAFWGLPGADDAAARAAEIAEELDDVALRSAALDALGVTAFREGDFAKAYELETSRFQLRPRLKDPDLVHDLYLSTIPTAAAVGKLDEARQLAQELIDVVAELTPHHRLHGAAVWLEQEELGGRWDSVLSGEREITRAVADNRDTPCVRNARSLLLCALARELAGDGKGSAELEAVAEELKSEGHGAALATPRARLALARGRLDVLEELLADEEWLHRQTWFALPAAATRLDALAVIGSEKETESATQTLAPPGSYVEPFALRALGITREDEELLRRAHERFGTFGLAWYAEQTDELRRLRASAA